MYLDGPGIERGYYGDDGGLGSFWTKIRDKVIKPVGRVVAAYYTGGASEVAFKAYDAKEAQKKMIAAQKKQQAELMKLEAMGNTYPPQGYPSPMDPAAMMAYRAGMPSGYPQPINPYLQAVQPQYTATGAVAMPVPPAYNQVQPAPPSSPALQPWVIPAGIGALVLVALAARR